MLKSHEKPISDPDYNDSDTQQPDVGRIKRELYQAGVPWGEFYE